MTIKTRLVLGAQHTNISTRYGAPQRGHNVVASPIKEAQYVSSEGHPFRQIGKGADVGGPFISQKIEMSGSEPRRLWYKAIDEYYGRVYTSSEDYDLQFRPAEADQKAYVEEHSPPLESNVSLASRGTTAIARCKPTNPVFDGSTFMAELISERKLFAIPGRNGGVSGEYLNYQLGAAPAYGAFQDFRKAAENSETLLRQLHRDSGRSVRRRYEFPPEETGLQEQVSSGVYPYFENFASGNLFAQGTRTTRTWETRRRWFSGAFTYYIPEDLTMRRSIAELDYLYGIKPGVDTAWELIPFSFVADYFANMGDVVSNLNSFASDGLVMRYGYIMSELTRIVDETWVGPLRQGTDWVTTSVASHRVYTVKQRLAATPYGFGVLQEDLTPKQLSILAALGLSRR